MMENLTEQEILDYLMTSDFNEGLTPDEFRFLLSKFRNFYRISKGKSDIIKSDLESKKKEIDDLKFDNKRSIDRVLSEKAQIQNEFDMLKNRNLSFRERWTGKIILEK